MTSYAALSCAKIKGMGPQAKPVLNSLDSQLTVPLLEKRVQSLNQNASY
jgi:hypothetical protein